MVPVGKGLNYNAMMRLVTIVLLFAATNCQAQDARSFLQVMYNRYHGKWRESLIFTQHTEKYRNDSLVATETWYETMVYPNNFRIDFGVPDSGNCIIFRNDSAYVFRAHMHVKSKADTNELLYFLGGMYFAPAFGEVCKKFRALGVDPDRGYRRGSVMVIGAASESDRTGQLWVEDGTYKVVRLMKFDNGHESDAIFKNHKKAGGAWCETLVEFYEDGKLRQKESYVKLKANKSIPASMFSPVNPWLWHWAK